MPPALQRAIGARGAVLVTIGAMVGSGIFAEPSRVAQLVPTVRLQLVLWCTGGALSLLGALCFAEGGAAIPETGGLYVYLRRAFGPVVAFVFAWTMLFVLVPSSVGYFAQVTAEHTLTALGASMGSARGVATVLVGALVLANVLGVRAGAMVQHVATVLKYGGVIALALLALTLTRGEPLIVSTAARAPAHPAFAWALALVPVLWTYDGWIDVTSVAGELKDPARDIPRGVLVGSLLVTALYVLVNVGYLRALGSTGLAATQTPAADVARMAFGPRGAAIVALLVAVATAGAAAVALLTGSRVVYAGALDRVLPAPVGFTTRTGAPAGAVIACGALAVLYLLSPLRRLSDLFVVGAWPFYALGALAIAWLRVREPALPRPYRVPLAPAPMLLFALTSLAIVGGYAASRPEGFFVSLIASLSGLPWYFYQQRRHARASH